MPPPERQIAQPPPPAASASGLDPSDFMPLPHLGPNARRITPAFRDVEPAAMSLIHAPRVRCSRVSKLGCVLGGTCDQPRSASRWALACCGRCIPPGSEVVAAEPEDHGHQDGGPRS